MTPQEAAYQDRVDRWRKERESMHIRLPGDDEPEPPLPAKERVYHGFHRGSNPNRDYSRQSKPKHREQRVVPMPEPGEVQLKAALLDEAERKHTTPEAIRAQIKRGKYPNWTLRRAAPTIVFVTIRP